MTTPPTTTTPTSITTAPTSTDGPIGVLNRFYDAETAYLDAGGPGHADFAGIAATLDPDVVMHQSAQLPYAGTWCGHHGLEKFFAAMSATWSRLQVVDPQFLTHDDTVVVVCRLQATARATGTELDFPMSQVITVRDGRITEFRPFYWDTLAVATACRTPGTTVAKGYVVFDLTITDPAAYEAYRQLGQASVRRWGGSVLSGEPAPAGVVETLEGDWDTARLVILQFDSLDIARRWYASPEYQHAAAARQAATSGRVVLIEGWTKPW